ncbi:hypothetical protein LEP1GSC188_4771 [Leptospira weilii serovar Topaz str. LT2116]|uniref:Uncharacterized protein n=1 Tax=Leptospira weilii serovar Topaz str. LT2116 TaxID=1088540 RepID=M3H111_9LEPT|nr:hypothetical protein LEP1GSC188_4771 [Leptospira weilii serovar Topaz str. LT2116]
MIDEKQESIILRRYQYRQETTIINRRKNDFRIFNSKLML